MLVAVLTTSAVVALPARARADWVRDRQWYLRDLDVMDAQELSDGRGSLVAVIDTGVYAEHPDMAGRVLTGTDLTQGRGVNGGGRTDVSGHGTAMAGLIAASGRGGDKGLLGIAPAAKILPVRNSTTLKDFSSTLPASIRWAVDHGANVLCLAVVVLELSPELREAVEAALRSDIVVVAGVGNRPDSSKVGYPAAIPGVVAAAGLDRNGNHAAVSVTGPEVVLSAPAVDIVSTDKGGGYLQGTGTSNSTAIIAGAAALIRSKYPDLSAKEVVHRLTATATDKGPPGRDDEYGYGALNLVAALTANVPPATPTTTAAAAPPAQPREEKRGSPLLIVLAGCALLSITIAAAAVFLIRRKA
jgi:type VII secretion-associated serine protease mycosin